MGPVPHTAPATWFNGRDSRAQPVLARFDGQRLSVHPLPEGGPADAALPPLQDDELQRWRLAEPYRCADTPVHAAGGGMLWLARGQPQARALALALAAAAKPPQRAARWAASKPAAVLAALLVAAWLAWFHLQGVGLIAQGVLAVLPRAVDEELGRRAFVVLRKELALSKLPVEREQRLQRRFQAMVQAAGLPRDTTLAFHREQADQPGFNAMALPHGLVIVFDGLAEAMGDDELAVVLAHELGHLHHRHSMRTLVRALGLGAAASAVLGDFSSVGASLVAGVQTLHHSREAEREADAHGRALLRRLSISPEAEIAAWQMLLAHREREGAAAGAGLPALFSSHPGIEERLAAARVAAQAAPSSAPVGAAAPAPASLQPNGAAR